MTYAPGTNTGHGHIWPRPDGVKARCGGPGLCRDCALDEMDRIAQRGAPPWLQGQIEKARKLVAEGDMRAAFKLIVENAATMANSDRGFEDMHDLDRIRQNMPEPNYQGTHGRAWLIDQEHAQITAQKEGFQGAAEQWANVATWLIEAPYAHGVWHSYVLSLIHLRDLPGQPPPVINLPGATHEFFLMALDPEGDRAALLADGCLGPKCESLRPINFAAQIIQESDDEALALLQDAVHDICDRKLNPDTDARRDWVKRFGGSNVK